MLSQFGTDTPFTGLGNFYAVHYEDEMTELSWAARQPSRCTLQLLQNTRNSPGFQPIVGWDPKMLFVVLDPSESHPRLKKIQNSAQQTPLKPSHNVLSKHLDSHSLSMTQLLRTGSAWSSHNCFLLGATLELPPWEPNAQKTVCWGKEVEGVY